jgi:hypothetical protein
MNLTVLFIFNKPFINVTLLTIRVVTVWTLIKLRNSYISESSRFLLIFILKHTHEPGCALQPWTRKAIRDANRTTVIAKLAASTSDGKGWEARSRKGPKGWTVCVQERGCGAPGHVHVSSSLLQLKFLSMYYINIIYILRLCQPDTHSDTLLYLRTFLILSRADGEGDGRCWPIRVVRRRII